MHDTKEKYVGAVAPFKGKTNDQLKAVFVETLEFRHDVLKMQAMIDTSENPDQVIAGVSLKWPDWVMTPF